MTTKSLGPGFKVIGNKVVKDRKAQLAKLDVSTRIAARENAKTKIKFTRNPRPKGG